MMTPAMAQNGNVAPLADENGPAEIVVTAEHRQVPLQKVPIAITAFSGDVLQRLDVEQPIDLARVTPGLSAYNATSGGTPLFAIRGVGMDDFNPNNVSGVATYLDGAGISSPQVLSAQMFDVERVEVLKGPQGTLYGRNATGGAINLISAAPTRSAEGYVDASYGRWNMLELKGAVSGPVSDVLSLRLAGTYTKSDGWQRDIDSGKRLGAPDRLGLRLAAEYRPANRLTIKGNVHYSRDQSISPSPQSANSVAPGDILDTGTKDARYVRTGSLDPHRDDTGWGGVIQIDYEAEKFNITSVSSFDSYRYISVDNIDGQPSASFDFHQDDKLKQFYQELRMVSSQGLFNDLVDWVIGASYSDDSIDGRDFTDQSTSFVGAYLPTPDFASSGLSVARANYRQVRKSLGLFGSTETHLSDRLTLVIGGRYSHDRLRFNGVSTEEGSADGGVLFNGKGSVVASLDDARSYDKFSYRLGLNYQLGRTLFYAVRSTAYKSGAYYASPALDPASWGYSSPEEITAHEAGVKARLFSGILDVNGAAFQYDYKNRQTLATFVSPATGLPTGSLGTVPKSRIRGFEVEATLRPVRGLELGGAVSYLDSEILDTITSVRGAPLLSSIPEGSGLSMAPTWSYSLRGSYLWDADPRISVRANADWSWASDQLAVLADPLARFGPNESLNASVDFAHKSSGVTASIFARNITNNQSINYSFTSFFYGSTYYRQQPTSYGVRLRYDF